MAVKVYSYQPIEINAGFRMECLIDCEEDKTMLQDLFVDLCCRCLDKHDLLFGYDENNDPVETMDYPVNTRFYMIYNNSDDTVIVVKSDQFKDDEM